MIISTVEKIILKIVQFGPTYFLFSQTMCSFEESKNSIGWVVSKGRNVKGLNTLSPNKNTFFLKISKIIRKFKMKSFHSNLIDLSNKGPFPVILISAMTSFPSPFLIFSIDQGSSVGTRDHGEWIRYKSIYSQFKLFNWCSTAFLANPVCYFWD